MHLDLCWTDPDIHHNYERVAGFSRFACFQPRGFGLSDQITYTPTIEQQADDILAVMDAVGMRRATLMGYASTCGAVALLAARVPERVHGLVLFMPIPYGWEAREDTHGWTASDVDAFFGDVQHAVDQWGSGESINIWGPAWATNLNRRLSALLERSSATPAAAQGTWKRSWTRTSAMCTGRSRCPRVSSGWVGVRPRGLWTLRGRPDSGRVVPSRAGVTDGLIDRADLRSDLRPPRGGGDRHAAFRRRGPFLGTVVFTDVVASTELFASVGDAKYQDLRANHERLVRLEVEAAGGQLMSVMGDGTLSVFDGPSKAVRCAESICRSRGRRRVVGPRRRPHRRAAARRDERHRDVGAHRRSGRGRCRTGRSDGVAHGA